MEMKPEISVVMAVYNGERHVKQQIESILSQTFQNFELIIVDDLSQDETLEIVKYFENLDSRVVVVENIRNLGVAKTFEVGINKASGDFIALSDQDDIWLPNHLQLLREAIIDHSLAHTDSKMFSDDDLIETLFWNKFRWVFNLNSNDKLIYLLFANYVRGASCMFRAELCQTALPFPEGIGMHDHWLAFCAANASGIADVDCVTTLYRRHNNTVTNERRFSIDKFVNWDPLRFVSCVAHNYLRDKSESKRLKPCIEESVSMLLQNRRYLIDFTMRNYSSIFGARSKIHRILLYLRLNFYVFLCR